jgi:pimeloyl-ACP methyl ester carboxylesterase
MREFEVVAADGTRLRGWCSDGSGPPVLLCPGLGTTPEVWPALRRYPSLNGDAPPSRSASVGVRVFSWYHRGTMGSRRPVDEARIELDDHVADALAVLDSAGVRRCVVMGWSMGVMVAAELARRCPDRVAGLLLVAGVPGDPIGAMFGVLSIPAVVRRLLALGGVHTIKVAGPLVDAVLHRVPANTVTATLLRGTGLIRAAARPVDIAIAMRRFLQHDWRWYATLALAVSSVPARDLRGITCPVTVLAGRYDLISDPVSVTGSVSALPQARTRILPATHLLPLELPEVINDELTLLVDRVGAVERARERLRPPRPEPIDTLIPRALTFGSRRRA